MGDRARSKWAEKLGPAAVPLSWGSWVPIEHNVTWVETYTFVSSGILVHPAVRPYRHGPKSGRGLLCPFRGGSWVPI